MYPRLQGAATLAAFLLTVSVSPAQADSNHNESKTSASSHAPISVMGDHQHKAGEWMMSYRFMDMQMDQNYLGSNRVAAERIVGSMQSPGRFMVAPTSMPMRMHMLGGMVGWSDTVTIMLMTNYIDLSMDHVTRMGGEFTTKASGFGDTSISMLYGLKSSSRHKWHLNMGVSLPTGSINQRDDTPLSANALLPYPMQLGSGTYDLKPGVTYNGRGDQLSWGAQLATTIRLGRNDNGYTLGDRLQAKAWLAQDLNDSFSLSAGLSFQDWGEIDGRNAELNPRVVQTADTSLSGGSRIDASIGLNYLHRSGHRLAVEFAQPIRQNLDGPQLGVEQTITVGWQKAF